MTMRLTEALFCSLCLHLAAIWVFRHGTPAEYLLILRGEDNAVAARANVLMATLLTARTVSATIPAHPLPENKIAVKPEKPLDRDSAKSEESNSFDPAEALPYLPAGRLTRPPVLLSDIDLNVAEITELAHPGRIELTILIDANGLIADVLPSVENADMRLFADRVAARLSSVRFLPGELEGNPVKSQLKIIVVSEDLPAGTANSSQTPDLAHRQTPPAVKSTHAATEN